jgi:hypothetical protein
MTKLTKQASRLCRGTSLINAIKKQDMYGVPITLAFENDNTYKTFEGGMMTILTGVFVIIFLGIGIQGII